MQSNMIFKRLLLIVGIVGIGFSAMLLSPVTDGKSIMSPGTTLTERKVSNSTLPVRLSIPKIKVDAAVQYVGLTSAGAMETPKDPAEVGWYSLGPRPGENGSAVIAGHFGWENGIPAVFDKISTLRKGDKIYVEDGKGAIITFVVREIRTYDPTAEASEVFDSSDEKAHLNLITCEGVWDAVSKSYSKRLVVFADQET
jgi:LPXTG-site transpeptidase (sortase) family protein